MACRRVVLAGRNARSTRAQSASRSSIPATNGAIATFPSRRCEAVEALCQDIIARRRIPAHRIVGHSDIAPTRKSDPGELFDWPHLARAGIGLWPEPAAELRHRRGRGVGIVERARALADLARIGYQVEPGNVETAACGVSAPLSPRALGRQARRRDLGPPRRGGAAFRCVYRRARSGQARPLSRLPAGQLNRSGRAPAGRRATSCPA